MNTILLYTDKGYFYCIYTRMAAAASATNNSTYLPQVLCDIFKDAPVRIDKYKKRKNNTTFTNNTLLGITTSRLVRNARYKTNRAPRAVFETTTPEKQCFKALGMYKKNAYDTPCNVCGLLMSDNIGFTPECDHILPIAQAVGLTGLEQSNTVSKSSIKINTINEPTLKYQWIHMICNRFKLDWVFIMVGKDNKYTPDVDKLKNNLWNLWHNRVITDQYEYTYKYDDTIKKFVQSDRNDGQTTFTVALWSQYKKEYKNVYGVEGTFEEVCDYFINTRCDAMIEKTYQPLCDKLNDTGNPQMNTLVAAIRAKHGNKHMKIYTPTPLPASKKQKPNPSNPSNTPRGAIALYKLLQTHGDIRRTRRTRCTRRTRHIK